MHVLGIETSCDETGVALVHPRAGVLGEALHSQVAVHAAYGGVVPELASRDHVLRLVPLVRETLSRAGLALGAVDAIAFTAGPGLVGALLVGASVARGLGLALDVPVLGVHHMEGHLLAPMLEPAPPRFPFLALLVSGGHTLLVEVTGLGRYRVLGESLDDAVGEAFDKTAKLLDLGYPGGPAVERLAASGDPARFDFPRPMTRRPGLDFSFSGLKTHTVVALQKHRGTPGVEADIARAFLDAVVDTLAIKCRRALRQSGLRRLVVAGGVSANRRLRERLGEVTAELGAELYFPRPAYCTDNGAMIAYAGCLRLQAGQRARQGLEVHPRWPLASLSPPV